MEVFLFIISSSRNFILRHLLTLRRCLVPGFGPRDENEAINGALILTSSDLYITADGVLHFSEYELTLITDMFYSYVE